MKICIWKKSWRKFSKLDCRDWTEWVPFAICFPYSLWNPNRRHCLLCLCQS